MSLYTIAAASLTTHDDRTRRPAIDPGMVARTLVLCLLAALALVLMHRQSHAAGSAATSPFQCAAAEPGTVVLPRCR